MSGVEIRQRTASEEQRGNRRRQEGRPTPLNRASWNTEIPVANAWKCNEKLTGQYYHY